MDKITAVKNIIWSWDNDDIINAYNDYCREYSCDDEVYVNDEEFFNTFFENRTLDAVRAVCFGEYNYSDDYVWFNGYSNLESGSAFDVVEKVDLDYLAKYVLDEDYNDFSEDYLNDLISEFKEQFAEEYHMEFPEEFDFDEFNLVEDNWDEIAEQIVAGLD